MENCQALSHKIPHINPPKLEKKVAFDYDSGHSQISVLIIKKVNLMSPHHTKLLAISVAALSLGACATQQTPAPVVSGLDNSSYNTPATDTTTTTDTTAIATSNPSTNPYGATPYDPNTTTTTTTTAETPVATTNTTTQPHTYVGNYSPVDVNANTHVVQSGDTVYNISKRYGISQENLRAWNNISEDNTVHLGQTLRVKPISSTTTTTVTASPAVTAPASTPVIASSSQEVAGITWQSPTKGKISKPFGQGTEKNQKNSIYLSGSRGQAVVAAANGQVVYSGKSLKDYGNLVIIQHNSKYLTAYGSNEAPLLVREGQQVKRGQQIATMGDSDKFGTLKLHFEIRENGTPVNPSNFIKFQY